MGNRTPRRLVRSVALAAAVSVVSPLAFAAQAAPQLQLEQGRKTYIVQLAEDPVATYDGNVRGIPATKPAPGEKVDPTSPNARAYEAHLRSERARTLQAAGVSSKRVAHEYTVSLNGFSAELTAVEAAKLAKTAGVVNVWEDEVRTIDTVQTPDYLGLTGRNGVWRTQFGTERLAGHNIVVGVIDTGIDPDNPSFAPLPGSNNPFDWRRPGRGVPGNFECETGNDPAFECSSKIVGARWYGEDFGNTVINEEYRSPRDRNGHGSHTAGTAAGNHGVDLTIKGQDLGKASGMAPAAKIAVYKALWQTADGNGSGTTSGLVAAIDDAVADGVDVINYSVSGSRTSIVGPDEIAFLFAADAGVFVSTSAGNSGDTVGVSSVAHNAPWTMTVAASTHNRGARNTLTLGNGQTYEGVGYGGPLDSTPMVLSENVPATGVAASEARLCAPGSLDDDNTQGMLVVCTRGAYALVDKAQEVKDSGGAGMVLVNDPAGAGGQNAILYGLPATHLLADDGQAVKAYVESATNPTGSLSETVNTEVNAPQMASFSSYGPALAGGGDLLKPDITAPGVDVAAAYHQDWETGEPTFDQISGTSMSTPHIAGLAALMKQKNPTWSPMAVKSAMMTTARTTDDAGDPIARGSREATPFDFGAGEVIPAASYNAGLVYDSDWDDWLAYACAIGQLASPCPETPTDPSDLNYPSIAVGSLAGQQTVTRTVTNVGRTPMAYTAQVQAPAGTTVSVNPSRINIRPGRTATFTVTITHTTAPAEQYTFGSLTWVPQRNWVSKVRSPIAVRPVALAAPGEVTASGVSGSLDYQVTTGFAGTLQTEVKGLVPSAVTQAEPESDGPEGGDGLADALFPITVPAGTTTLRVAIFDSEISEPGTDMDLYLADDSFQIVGQSAVEGSDESITLTAPASGTYYVAIDYWDAAAGVSATVPTHVWTVPDTDEGNLTVTPESTAVETGEVVDVLLEWTGLEGDRRYLGSVDYSDGSQDRGRTLVSVTTD